jgi:XTP/dITP diphosphohydrolase
MLLPEQIILASGNVGKFREIADIFSSLGVSVTPQDAFGIESPEETGATFIENALLKARHAAQISGLPAIADDSGLSVDALDGRPGVRSARYAGDNATDDENVDRLLEEMTDVPDENRGGGFYCAAVLVFPDTRTAPLVIEAVWRGEILRNRIGAGGFGYDPVFLDKDANKTGAQMSREEKNAVSHRGKAFRELRRRLQALTE